MHVFRFRFRTGLNLLHIFPHCFFSPPHKTPLRDGHVPMARATLPLFMFACYDAPTFLPPPFSRSADFPRPLMQTLNIGFLPPSSI